MDTASVEECVFRCTDCLIPSLRDAIDEVLENGSFDQVHEFAGQLAQKKRSWGEAEFIRYKAILAASGQPSLGDTAQLLDLLEEAGYVLTADESAYIARNNLEFIRDWSAPEEAGLSMEQQ